MKEEKFFNLIYVKVFDEILFYSGSEYTVQVFLKDIHEAINYSSLIEANEKIKIILKSEVFEFDDCIHYIEEHSSDIFDPRDKDCLKVLSLTKEEYNNINLMKEII